jgi:hypothetical protein
MEWFLVYLGQFNNFAHKNLINFLAIKIYHFPYQRIVTMGYGNAIDALITYSEC